MSDDFEPKHDFFVGIDSDGCAFDTMEVKHKECFIPNIIKHYNLASVSKYAREAAEFVNLYSKWRGINRFPALLLTMDLLRERPEVQKRGVQVPVLPAVRKWVDGETKLGNPALAQAVEKTGDEELKKLLEWSTAVNRTVGEIVHNVPPFPMVRDSVRRLGAECDVFVVSATPNEALTREWEEHDLRQYVARICGQETGTKAETLRVAVKYPRAHVLMVGDAPGDLKAARANGALFFPVNPGAEDASWKRFHEEAIDRFLAGDYAGEYETRLIEEFETYLPETPPWK
jgi:phosphoglycolate phosphatase-like HAD superfamily hydrolase